MQCFTFPAPSEIPCRLSASSYSGDKARAPKEGTTLTVPCCGAGVPNHMLIHLAHMGAEQGWHSLQPQGVGIYSPLADSDRYSYTNSALADNPPPPIP